MKTFAVIHGHSPAATLAPGRFLKRVWTAMNVMQERHDLRELDARALRDIGLTEGQALREANRPFWDLPAGR